MRNKKIKDIVFKEVFDKTKEITKKRILNDKKAEFIRKFYVRDVDIDGYMNYYLSFIIQEEVCGRELFEFDLKQLKEGTKIRIRAIKARLEEIINNTLKEIENFK